MIAETNISTRRPELSSAKRALLEKRLRGEVAVETKPVAIPRRMRFGAAPLSSAQQRLWFLDQLRASALYNVPMALRLRGELNLDALAHAIGSIVARHDALRTRFSVEDGTPLQASADPSPFLLPEIDLTLQPEGRRENDLRQLLEREASRPFDLLNDELFRALLIRVGDEENVLFINQHHIISDAWSLGVFFRELAFFYNNFVSGRSFLTPELPIQYADYAAWQREWMQSEGIKKDLDYWKRHLDGAPQVIELPTDHPRPAMQSFRGRHASRLLPKPLADALKQLGHAEGATLFMTLLTAFKMLLHRYTRQDRLVVGAPIAGRNRLETEGLIGFFVNTLPLHTDLSGNPTFREALGRVRQVTLDGYAHQDLPFDRIVEELQPARDPSYSPLVQVMFMLQNDPATVLKLPGVTARPIPLDTATSKFDLTLSVEEQGNGLAAKVEFCADLFEDATVERMLGHFQTLLEGIIANPSRRIGELPMLTEAERAQVLLKWNHTRTNYPRERTITRLFEEQAEQTPGTTALIFEEKPWTYLELNQRANQLAHYLTRIGVAPGAKVGICLERSFEMIVALLAVLKAGGAYVSLDPAYPRERLAVMLEDAGIPVLLTQEKWRDNFSSQVSNVVCLDKDRTRIERENRLNPESNTTAESPAYVSFTSGSTGRPKGVCVPHRGVVRLVKQTNYATFSRSDVVLQLAPIAFDASTFEIWGALLNGATLAVFPPQTPSLDELGDFVQRNGVTTLWLTAGLFHQMVEEKVEGLRGVRQLLAGGDVLSVAHVKKALEQLPGCHLINGYGPTENTTFTCCHRIYNADGRSIPIGRPIANTQVYILDKNLQPLPVGVPGELFAGGDGVALGYINQPRLTAEKFIPNPFSNERGAKLYRTGDLVRWLPDGTVEFLGRIDTQVKIRGFRIELGEIETALNHHPAIRECVVAAHQNGSVDKTLVAYYVAESPAAPSATELREHLRKKLPDYMVPAAFMPLPALPLNANGKVNRDALPAPEKPALDPQKQFVAPRDEVETKLARIWEDVLNVRPVGVNDHFFELGGHSLMAVRLVARVEKTFGKKIPMTTVFQLPSVGQLAEVIRGGKSAAGASSLVDLQPKGMKPPLFFVHGVGGGMFWGYTNLSKHLGDDQPVYAFNSRGLEGRPEFPTIKEMAAHYVSDLQKFRSRGPYFLGGYCFGGVVALEMARQLKARGEEVPFVALINSIPPKAGYDRFRLTPSSFGKFLKNLSYWAGYVLGQPPKAQRDFFLWKLRVAGKRLARCFRRGKTVYDFDVHEVVDLSAQPAELHELWNTHIRMLFAHRPEFYPGQVTLFRTPGYSLVCSFDEAYCWRKFAAEVDVKTIPGAHESILDEPNVRFVAGHIAAALRDIQKEEGRQ